jgi:hypothetical protein
VIWKSYREIYDEKGKMVDKEEKKSRPKIRQTVSTKRYYGTLAGRWPWASSSTKEPIIETNVNVISIVTLSSRAKRGDLPNHKIINVLEIATAQGRLAMTHNILRLH